ncbi:pentatricopeptide repeat-containing protein At4g21065 [Selaginella moellendorffii]|nr:pentatricopeptide repeat-containing protein At4g21065 [Selaginella moellendorffii]|eukprot:XP_002986608.2 pentatricopeptide repeat-containing protein At4g21065 [Selaginella moellendorffii]
MLKKHTIWKTKKPTIATTRKNACSSSSSSRKHDPLDSLEREIQSDSFAAAIRSCKDSNSVSIIHQKITRAGLGSSAYLNNLLVLMLAKHGSLCKARSIFDTIQHKNIFSWNIIISAYAHRGHPSIALHLFAKMDVPPTAMTFATALSACSSLGDLQRGREIHARIKASPGIRPSVILDTAIFSMYAKCGDLSTAKSVFDRIPAKNVVSWNALIAAYAQSGHSHHQALDLFEKMAEHGVRPCRATFVGVLGACSDVTALEKIHARIVETGLQFDVVVATCLLNAYAKLGLLLAARRVFDRIDGKSLVSWNSMITAYVQREQNREAIHLFRLMAVDGVLPDHITFVAALSSCSSLEDGRIIHSDSLSFMSPSIDNDARRSRVLVDTAAIKMYARYRRLDEARRVFESMESRDVVAWNAMIGGCSQLGELQLAMEFFGSMSSDADKTTFTIILSACSTSGALAAGREIHEKFIALTEYERDLGVQNALLNMYAKCGSLEVARDIFRKMERRDQVSMNVMIAAFAQQGLGKDSIQVFREMDLEGLPQDDTTFASVITACSCCGALEFGKRIHKRVVEPVLGRKCCLPNVVVETALVSMYGKCGTLEQAKAVFKAMTTKNSVSWNAMLAACAHQGQGDEAAAFLRAAACEGVELDSASFISVLIACSHSGMLEVAYDHFQLMLSDFDLVPAAENYRCMVDLLARSGRLGDADELMNSMPFSPDAIAWRTLLGGCRVQGSLENAASAAEQAFNLEPQNTAPYTLLSSLYSATGKKDELVELRSSMKERGLRKLVPGRSVIEVHGRVHEFVAGDSSHPQTDKILRELDILNVELKQAGFVPSTDGVVHDLKTEDKEEILALHSEKLAVAFGLISTKSGIPLLVLKNLRVCSDCHAAIKLISKLRSRVITVRDANRFHRFQSGTCSCGDYW